MRDSMRFQLFFDLDRTLWNYEKNVDAVLINLINCFSEISGLKPNEARTKFKSINEKLWVDMQKKNILSAMFEIGDFFYGLVISFQK